MKLISTDEINGTQITAEDIRSDIDMILIPKNTLLKESYIPALRNLNITQICVQEEVKDLEIKDGGNLLFPEEIIRFYEKTLEEIIGNKYKESEFLKIEVLAEKIVDFIKDNPSLKVNVNMERTPSIIQHSIMVAILSTLVAVQLELPRTRMYQIAIASLLHDIGLLEMGFSPVGLKEELLDKEKLEAYHSHPIKIREKLDNTPWITEDAKEIVVSHHERLNGEGFPYKKKRQSIGCRIVQVVDAYDRRFVGIEDEKFERKDLKVFMDAHKSNRFDKVVVEILFQVIAK